MSLHRRWLALRNRLLASPRFQRWASGFPLTRPIARRRARSLFDLCAGFVYSQILFACIELDLFEHLAGGPVSLGELAKRMGLPETGALRLLKSAASLGLIERSGPDHFVLGELGAALRGNPGIAAMV
ncbi:MAG TPA: methyltransferase dimerization domain-containing protein, partial [Lamprocystis sp. (in: g-proteobacteria)]|nr:methyltransferase dimerization domain-containing protein [Lamprocystis sp. (in: g-proteobacteria)]